MPILMMAKLFPASATLDEDGIGIIKLDAPAEHQYDAEKMRDSQVVCKPYEEVQFALYEYIFMEH